jgi:hypothetical protein
VSAEAKSEDVEKNKEKSSYEFGQPAFRRDLRKQIEVGSSFAVLVFQGSRRGQKHSSFYLQESKADLLFYLLPTNARLLHLMLLTSLSHSDNCRLITICCTIMLGETIVNRGDGLETR